MSELLDIIISAVDEASSVFESITGSAESMSESLSGELGTTSEDFQTMADNASSFNDVLSSVDSSSMDELASSLGMDSEELERLISTGADIGSMNAGFNEVASAADMLEQEVSETDDAVNQMNNDLGIINSSMMLQLGEQVGAIGDGAEEMAQEMNTAAITVGQLATQTGIAEPKMADLVSTISNATFPQEEAMMYIKSLDQMGVASQNLGASATGLDRINDAFHLGAEKTNSLGQELGVLGVDMNNVSSAFNALAYANSNTVGGMENYYTFLRKYDSQFKELGYNVDQSSIIIAAATQKYGGGRAALSGLSSALKEADGDSRKLEEALGIQSGTLDKASDVTGQYSGQLDKLADEESEHKTILDQVGAAWEDVTLQMSGILSPLGSVIGLIGGIGSFGLQVSGLLTLTSTMKGAIGALREFNLVQTLTNAIEGEGAIARAASAIGITTEAAATEGATVAFGGLAVAEGAALWPILAIAAAIAALVVVVYEVGKAFGWWNDIGSMLDAIWAGVQRLWSAFINHPDVQAAIQTIMAAWDWLSSAIGHAWEAILKFFNVSTGGEFDIVRALIEGIGTAWNIITAPIKIVIDLVQRVIKFFKGLAPAVNGAWSAISNAIAPYVNIIKNTIGALIDIFNRFRSGQLDLPTAIIGALKVLWTAYMIILKRISTLAVKFASQMWNNAVKAGSNFVKGIVTHIKTLAGKVLSHINETLSNIRKGMAEWIRTGAQRISDFIRAIIDRIRNLPGRFHDFLVSVLHGIQSVGQSWINTAKNRASSLVNGVIGYIKGLPGKVGAGLSAVISTITGGINAWITNAKTYVSNLISAITTPFTSIPSKISSALSGVVDTITAPFRNAYNSVKPIIDAISAASSAISGRTASGGDIVGGHDYGNYYGNLGGTLTRRKVSSTTSSKSDKVKGELDVNLNFTGLPSNINEKTLVKALSSKKVIDSLVKNKDFQNLDLQVKTKMASKNKRARGA